MQKTKNFFVSVVMAVMMLFSSVVSFGGINKKEANALSPDYPENAGISTVYYFSDSTPAFQNIVQGYIGLNVFVDVQPLLTPQELAYMLYSGYFWGFDQTVTNIVIIELKTMMPDPEVLMNLFECLDMQGCKVMFISPYQPDFTDYYEFVDSSMACNHDKYSRYLKNSIRSMLDEYGTLRYGTTILLDGRFIGINGVLGTNDLTELCASSATLRRLLHYLYYNADTGAEADFEEYLYRGMWQSYKQFMYGLGFDIDLDYFGSDKGISDYFDVWQSIDYENRKTQINDFRHNDGEEYLEAYAQQAEIYYSNIAADLRGNFDLHIAAHISGNSYVDIMNMTSSSNVYTFNTYADVLSAFPLDAPHYIYSMGIWPLNSAFFNLLYNIQKMMPNEAAYSNVERRPYIWSETPIPSGGNFEITTEDQLQTLYGDTLPEHDQSLLEEEFTAAFESLF